MSDDLGRMLRQLDVPEGASADGAFVHGLELRVGVEALIAREGAAARNAMAHDLVSVGSIVIAGTATAWLAAGSLVSIAAAVAASLACWMLIVDWHLPEIALVED